MPVIAPLWQTDPIRYLLNDKYPLHYTISLSNNKQPLPESNKVALQEMKEFHKSLEKKPIDELATLVLEARQREDERTRLYYEQIEAEAFFNQPSSNADFDRWSRISYWTLEEGVALSFGKNPEIVNLQKMKTHNFPSPFIAKYTAKCEEVRRAKVMSQLWDSTLPIIYIKWAKRVGFEMPEALTSLVLALGVQGLDWKEAFEKEVLANAKIEKKLSDANQNINDLVREHGIVLEKFAEDTKTIISGFQENLTARDQLIAKLKQENVSLSITKPVEAKNLKKDIGARERDSLLKLILGMAMAGYKFDPNATRSAQIQEISDDLIKLDLSLDADTVRKYLNEAKALFADVLTEQKD